MTEHTCRICGKPAFINTSNGKYWLCARHDRAVQGGVKAMERFADYRTDEWCARLVQKVVSAYFGRE
jgi:hypothetical protein